MIMWASASNPNPETLFARKRAAITVASVAALVALQYPVNGQTAEITETGRAGRFVFDGTDLSAEVAADSEQGIYVAPAKDASGASGAWVRKFTSGVVNIAWFGADRTGVVDSYDAIKCAVDNADGNAVFVPEGGFRIATGKNNEPIIELTSALEGLHVFGVGFKSRIYVDAAFTGATSTALFHRPAVGDNFGSLAAGANNLTFEHLRLDGNRSGGATYAGFSWGVLIEGGTGHIVRNIWSHGWEKGGIGIYSYAAEPDVEVQVGNVYCYGNNGTGGQGISIATKGVDSGRVAIDHAFCYGQSLGIDFSTGSASCSNSKFWNNTIGGGKLAGNDNQKVTLINCDFSDNADAGAQGFYTNGDFGLLIISGCRFERNNANGLQIAHSGTVMFNGAELEGNGGQGLYSSAGSPIMIMSGVNSRNNAERGFLLASGYISATNSKSGGNGKQGWHVTTLDSFVAANMESVDDCVTSETVGINLQPASSVSTYCIASAMVLDTRGAPKLTLGVSVGANVNEGKIGQVIAIGPTVSAMSDSGTDTVYFDRGDGWAKIATSGGRVGFFGADPALKQTVIGSKGGNAALASLMTALANMGLVTDSTT